MTTEEKRERRRMLARLRYANNPEERAKRQARARARIPEKCEYEKQKRRKEAAAKGWLLYKRKPIQKLAEDAILEEYQKEARIIQKEESGLYWWKVKSVLHAAQAARIMRAWHALDPEEKTRRSREKNAKRTPEQQAEYNRRYWEKLKVDPERKKELTRKWSKAARLAMKPHQKAKENLRKRFRELLKKFRTTGVEGASYMIGCSWAFLIKHIESLWVKGMSWENYGTAWHIDHIEPLASFEVYDKDDIRKAWHFSNLRPLWAKENIAKGDKVITHQRELLLLMP